MSKYFFDDSKDHEYNHGIHSRREIYRPAISPGKVTLTSRIVGAALAGGDRALSRKSRQPHTAPVQHEINMSSQVGAGREIPSWDIAFRPDLYSTSEEVHTPIQRKEQQDTEQMASPLRIDAGGVKLPADVQAKMEATLGADFSAVRIYEGSQAPALGARAYTQGTDIHFAPGEYNPHSQTGQELLGHELTHVVQQSQGRVSATNQAKSVNQ